MSLATAPGAFAAVNLTDAEAALIERANATLARVPQRSGVTGMHADELQDCLEDFSGLRAGTVHPERLFFDLAAGHPDDALAEAMERVAEDIRDWTKALDSLAGMAEAAAKDGGAS